MTEYQCAYDGLCNLVHRSLKNINGSWQSVAGCLVNNCIKEDKNYLKPIVETNYRENNNLNPKKSVLEKDVNSK